jgi:hypothetical protein
MDTNRAAYWIALAALALGLNSEYRQGNFQALHRVASHAETVLCRISTGAEHNLVMARALASTSEGPSSVHDLLASASGPAMTRNQAEQLRDSIQERLREQVQGQIRAQIRAQSEAIRAQAEMRRVEVERSRSEYALVSAVNRSVNRTVNIRTVFCPKVSTRVVVSVKPELADVSKEFDDTF